MEITVTQQQGSNSKGSGSGSGIGTSKRKEPASSFHMSGLPQKKSIVDMIRKTPEEIVAERHSSSTTQPTLEHCTKKSKEQNQIVDDHVADFLYENCIPLNVINSRSWEVLLESIGQFGPGYRSPSYHELRVPLLDRAKSKTDELKKKHQEAWEEYGCTLMSDGWTDMKGRHLINYLVNSPEGTFFLGSSNISSESITAKLLAQLLEQQINAIGKEHVVQIVTDNGANYKAAGRVLMDKFPTLFWTPCAAHCLDLMLEDVGKIKEFSGCITKAKKITRFIYGHGRILDLMRTKTNGRDLVRPATTRFATAFLTLASMWKQRQGLKSLFVSDEWCESKLKSTEVGKACEKYVLSVAFWQAMEDCMRASQPLLIVLRIADGDESPAMPEMWAAMELAKKNIKESLQHKDRLMNEVLGIVDKRWDSQMETNLYGAALFLNPSKFFEIRENNRRLATRLRSIFNDVMWKMETNEDILETISKQADDYERTEGPCFTKKMAIKDRDKKNPLLWWSAYGGLAYELQCLAKRIVSLCCAASGCERNWSTFSHVHTKKRNRLEHKRLSKLVYVAYNRKMASRFQKIREQGSQGKKTNPLILEEFQWENEWVDINVEPVHQDDNGDEGLTWAQVDEAAGATDGLRGRNLPRQARGDGPSQDTIVTYRRQRSNRDIIDTTIDEDTDDDMNSSDGDKDDSSAASHEFQLSDDLDV